MGYKGVIEAGGLNMIEKKGLIDEVWDAETGNERRPDQSDNELLIHEQKYAGKLRTELAHDTRFHRRRFN